MVHHYEEGNEDSNFWRGEYLRLQEKYRELIGERNFLRKRVADLEAVNLSLRFRLDDALDKVDELRESAI
jgi:hypothetical protein